MIAESIAAAVLLAGGNFAEYSTSRSGYARGAVDANGLVGPHGERLAVVKVVATAAETAGFVAIRKRHKALAWAWAGGITAVNVALARHNSRVWRKP